VRAEAPLAGAAGLPPRLNLHEARYQQGQDWRFVSKDALVFVHPPKVGGTSFFTFLAAFFADRGILAPRLRLADTSERTAEVWRDCRFFHTGSRLDQLRRLRSRAHFVTLLRDPVSRVISQYWYYRRPSFYVDRFPDLAARRRARRELAQRLSLPEWVRASPREPGAYVRNLYVAQFGGGPDATRSATAADLDALLERSSRALQEDFVFVGITEEYARAKELFCHTFGLPMHYARSEERINVTRDPEAREPPDAGTLELIRQENAHDFALYEFARQLCAARAAALSPLGAADQVAAGRANPGTAAAPPKGSLRLGTDILRGSGCADRGSTPRRFGRTAAPTGGPAGSPSRHSTYSSPCPRMPDSRSRSTSGG
jgi:hypothetical protein